jgi:hypothetical protein
MDEYQSKTREEMKNEIRRSLANAPLPELLGYSIGNPKYDLRWEVATEIVKERCIDILVDLD